MHSDEPPVTNRDVDSAVIKGATGYDSKEPDTDFEEPDRSAQQTAGPGLMKPDEDYGASNVDTIGRVSLETWKSLKMKKFCTVEFKLQYRKMSSGKKQTTWSFW